MSICTHQPVHFFRLKSNLFCFSKPSNKFFPSKSPQRFLSQTLFYLILIFTLSFTIPIGFIFAQSAGLDDEIAVLSTDTPQTEDVNLDIAFTLPDSSQSIIFSDYIIISLPYFSDVTVPGSLTGTYTGTPSYSVSGTTIKITGINVLANDRLEINGISVTNPSAQTTLRYTINLSVAEDEAGTLVKNVGSTVAQMWQGTITVSASVDNPQGRLQISGYTAPTTYVVFSEGENIIGTDVAGGTGVFSKLFASLAPTSHSISLYGIDTEDRNTAIVPMTINTPPYQTTTVSNILLSPTVEINSSSILQGADVYATGSAYPSTTVTVFTDSPLRTYTTSADSGGDWTTTINNTSSYTPGDYRLYTLAQTTGGLQSLTSPTIIFTVTSSSGGTGSACGDISNGDLNCDDIINLTDFSILMYYWGTADATADMNGDGIVNITDFSIMMYYWGT